ncbi:MAG: glycoside hydrolase [Oscillospiraceae bacterium]|nr:glycoside hydrolase [Oscillospiraceae bacterium]
MKVSSNLGRVSLVPRGLYNPNTRYERLDLVLYHRNAYVVIRPVQGVEPVDGGDYMLLAQGIGDGGMVPEDLFFIKAQSCDPELGSVSGSGTVFNGVTTTVTAHAEGKNSFLHWSENGETVSLEPSYSFAVDRDRTLLAAFEKYQFALQWAGSAMPVSAKWSSVAYGDGVFVAVSNTDKAACSSDGGKTWTESAMPSTVDRSTVTYGNGVFVTAGFNRYAAYSTDGGKTWTESDMLQNFQWRSIAFGDGVFIALGYVGRTTAARSKDFGKTWEFITMPSLGSSGNWYAAAYGDGVFVAIAYGSRKAAYSTDGGDTWTESVLPGTTDWREWRSAAYGDGVFVTVGWGGASARSTDGGKTWSEPNLPSDTHWSSVVYGNGTFVAVSRRGVSAFSTDGGENWTVAEMPFSENWYSVAYGDDTFVAVANSTSNAVFSV